MKFLLLLFFSLVAVSANAQTVTSYPFSFKTPASGTSFAANTKAYVMADGVSPNGIIRKVEFFYNGNLFLTDVTRPFTAYTPPLSEGFHVITAKATDSKGVEVTSVISIKTTNATLNKPSNAYFFNEAPYSSLSVFWDDNSANEDGFVIEQSTDGATWSELARTSANTTQATINNFSRTDTKELRVKATNGVFSSAESERLRLVGTSDTLETYPEVAGIRAPRTLTLNGITFSELQDQTPSQPDQGKATRISTFFSAEVRKLSDTQGLNSPVYETRPQIRNDLPQNDPAHSGGHKPYGYAYYGPSTSLPNYKLHSKHWTNFDASENVVVRVKLLSTASLPGPIFFNDLDIQPAPLNVTSVDANTIDITLPGATDFTRHYRVAVNRNAWPAAAGRNITITESPLFIFVNPMQPAPASAPKGQIKEFKNGSFAVFGGGIHLPKKQYQFLGEGENTLTREMYIPGDAYLHYGFLFKNDGYAVKVFGRGIYSDEMFDLYDDDTENVDYVWSSPTRTPWSTMDAIEGSVWGIKQAWDTHAWFQGKYLAQPTVFEGLTNIGARIGPMVKDGSAEILNHKDMGYGGGTYQEGTKSIVRYKGNLFTNDDDITYVHHNYTMDYCTSYVMHNGPSFQLGWEGTFNLAQIPTKVTNHTLLSSDRTSTSFWKNHGVFDSRLGLPTLKNHSGGVFENFQFWGRETIIFNMRIWDEDPTSTTVKDSVSILGDKTFKNFTIRNASYNKERIDTETNLVNNRKGYIRFIHFDNLQIAGQSIDTLAKFSNYFTYNDGLLLHTVTLFSLPAKVPEPIASSAPIGQTVVLKALANNKYVQSDDSLPVSLTPMVANDATLDTNEALNGKNGYKVVDAGNGYIALLAANGYYVKADPRRYGYMYTLPDTLRSDTDTKAITDDAKFIWVDAGNGSFALYSKSMGLYVRTEMNSGPQNPLYAASASIGGLETFTVAGYTTLPTIVENPKLFIEAESYTAQQGIQAINSNDIDGGKAVGFINNLDSTTYAANIPATQSIKAKFRVSSGGAGGVITVFVDNVSVGTVNVSNTGGWNNWITLEKVFDLPVSITGSSIRLDYTGGSGSLLNINWFEMELVPPAPVAPVKLVIEGEAYTTQTGTLLTNSTDTTGGGKALGSINNGDFATYNFTSKPAQLINASFRVAAAGSGGTMNVYANNTLIGSVTIAGTGGWNNWVTLTKQFILPASMNVSSVKLEFVKPNTTGFLYNLNWFELELVP